MVYNPILDELFVAARGQGATLNGRAIKTSHVESLGSAIFATEVGVTRDEATVSAVFSRMSALCQQVFGAHLKSLALLCDASFRVMLCKLRKHHRH